MVPIRQNLSHNNNHFWGTNPCNYITIHETGNRTKGANAEMHARYINSGSSATWHYTVDDSTIIQHFLDNRQCWHAGDRSGKGNTESIGIEICVNRDGNFLKAIDNAVDLVAKLIKKHDIPIRNIKQHNEWSGKNCPQQIRSGKYGITWKQFIDKVQSKLNNKVPPETNKLYRVQLGAFTNLDNAIKLKEELIAKGYKDAFIK